LTELAGTALVLGLGRSGRAAAAALERHGVEVTRVDRERREGAVPEEDASLAGMELLVKSPGVPGEHPLVAEARRLAIPVWSEIELGYRLVQNPILGVTGTNGKTTTVGLLAAMFAAAGRPFVAAGNEQERQLSDLDADVPDDAWAVCELSSFQLEDVDAFRPRVAVLVNLEPDHLDRHGTLDAYRAAKLRLFENQREVDVAVVPRAWGQTPGMGKRATFAATDPLPAEPLIPGAHNRENAAAATAAARAAGLDDDAIAEALRTFPGVAHRLELVAEIDGVRYVNDSKATNTAAARRGLAAFDAPLRLILGGSLKGESFRPLVGALGANVRSVHLIGEASGALAEELDRAGVDYRRDGDLETATRAAASLAEPGDVVLLSPACASYDQFGSFAERGEAFRRLVAELAGRD
jgi:UDP-N-acetylmuramoylalanine--D-glutamate ligase